MSNSPLEDFEEVSEVLSIQLGLHSLINAASTRATEHVCDAKIE